VKSLALGILFFILSSFVSFIHPFIHSYIPLGLTLHVIKRRGSHNTTQVGLQKIHWIKVSLDYIKIIGPGLCEKFRGLIIVGPQRSHTHLVLGLMTSSHLLLTRTPTLVSSSLGGGGSNLVEPPCAMRLSTLFFP